MNNKMAWSICLSLNLSPWWMYNFFALLFDTFLFHFSPHSLCIFIWYSFIRKGHWNGIAWKPPPQICLIQRDESHHTRQIQNLENLFPLSEQCKMEMNQTPFFSMDWKRKERSLSANKEIQSKNYERFVFIDMNQSVYTHILIVWAALRIVRILQRETER